ncbi:unnamed protein product, partial [Hapterophycus canaliculatus]
VEIDWNTLCEAKLEQKVPVSLFVLCKTIVENEGGNLFLNATVIQRVQVKNVPKFERDPLPDSPPKEEKEVITTQMQLEALMFDIVLKGPFPGGEIKIRRETTLTGVGTTPQSTWLIAQTLDLASVPIDACSEWHRFPFRILRGTVELELKAKSGSFGEGKGVFLCPTLCVSDPEKFKSNVVKAKPMGYLNRCRTLAILHEKPTIEVCGPDARLKRGVQAVRSGKDVFITFPLMRLTFWLHEPTSKAVFKVLGPPLLVVILMWVNFHEFYGIFSWEKDRDSDYLANGIGITFTAVFMIPLIRAETRNSHHGSFTNDDYVAVVFLVGLGVSTLRNCIAAFVGCLISSIVVVGAIGNLIAHHFECKKTREKARKLLQVKLDPKEPKDKAK